MTKRQKRIGNRHLNLTAMAIVTTLLLGFGSMGLPATANLGGPNLPADASYTTYAMADGTIENDRTGTFTCEFTWEGTWTVGASVPDLSGEDPDSSASYAWEAWDSEGNSKSGSGERFCFQESDTWDGVVTKSGGGDIKWEYEVTAQVWREDDIIDEPPFAIPPDESSNTDSPTSRCD